MESLIFRRVCLYFASIMFFVLYRTPNRPFSNRDYTISVVSEIGLRRENQTTDLA